MIVTLFHCEDAVAAILHDAYQGDVVVGAAGAGVHFNGERLPPFHHSVQSKRSTIGWTQGYAVKGDPLARTVRDRAESQVKRLIATWSPVIDTIRLLNGQFGAIVSFDGEITDLSAARALVPELRWFGSTGFHAAGRTGVSSWDRPTIVKELAAAIRAHPGLCGTARRLGDEIARRRTRAWLVRPNRSNDRSHVGLSGWSHWVELDRRIVIVPASAMKQLLPRRIPSAATATRWTMFGTHSSEPVDYPAYGARVAARVVEQRKRRRSHYVVVPGTESRWLPTKSPASAVRSSPTNTRRGWRGSHNDANIIAIGLRGSRGTRSRVNARSWCFETRSSSRSI